MSGHIYVPRQIPFTGTESSILLCTHMHRPTCAHVHSHALPRVHQDIYTHTQVHAGTGHDPQDLHPLPSFSSVPPLKQLRSPPPEE